MLIRSFVSLTYFWTFIHWYKYVTLFGNLTSWFISENYTTIIQEEAQSLHWGKTQCTIHSCAIWRPTTENEHQAANSDIPSTSSNSPAPSSQCQLDSHVKEYWLIISDDLNPGFASFFRSGKKRVFFHGFFCLEETVSSAEIPKKLKNEVNVFIAY